MIATWYRARPKDVEWCRLVGETRGMWQVEADFKVDRYGQCVLAGMPYTGFCYTGVLKLFTVPKWSEEDGGRPPVRTLVMTLRRVPGQPTPQQTQELRRKLEAARWLVLRRVEEGPTTNLLRPASWGYAERSGWKLIPVSPRLSDFFDYAARCLHVDMYGADTMALCWDSVA